MQYKIVAIDALYMGINPCTRMCSLINDGRVFALPVRDDAIVRGLARGARVRANLVIEVREFPTAIVSLSAL